MSAGTIRAFVDRIEGDKAVLLVGDTEVETVVLPTKYLPEGAGEGSVLVIAIKYDAKQTAKASGNVKAIIRRLTGRDS